MSLYRVPSRVLARHGETWTLRRETVASGANSWTSGSATVAYHEQKAHRRIDKINEPLALVADAQAILVMSPDYTAPQKGDRVAVGTVSSDTGIAWLEIVHVDDVRVQGQIAKYYAHVRD